MALLIPAPLTAVLITAARIATSTIPALFPRLDTLLHPLQVDHENETGNETEGGVENETAGGTEGETETENETGTESGDSDGIEGATFGGSDPENESGGESGSGEEDGSGDGGLLDGGDSDIGGGENGTGGGGDNETATGTGGNETAGGTGAGDVGSGGGGGGGGGGGISATQGPRDAGGGGGFGFDVGEQLSEIFTEIGDQVAESFADLLEVMVELVVGTPAPNSIVGAPTNEPWATAYEYYMGEVIPIALLLFVVVIASVAAAGTFSGILSNYQTNLLWWRSLFALLFLYFWWPLGAISLNFVDWLATTIAPDAAAFTGSTEEVLMGVAGTAVVAASLQVISTATVIGISMIYGARFVALAGLLIFMPVFVMLWVVDASIFTRISNLASGLASTFVPLLFLTMPAAILMRVGVIIFQAAASADWISAPVLMFLSLGTLLAALFAAPYTFKITQQFMAQSYGAERIGNMIDDQAAAGKAKVSEWYQNRGADPQTPASPPPTVAEKKHPMKPSPSTSASGGNSGTGGGGGSRPRISPKAGSTTATSGASFSASKASSATATGSSSPSNKYTSQQRTDNYRIESRRKQLTDDYFKTGFD